MANPNPFQPAGLFVPLKPNQFNVASVGTVSYHRGLDGIEFKITVPRVDIPADVTKYIQRTFSKIPEHNVSSRNVNLAVGRGGGTMTLYF